jgi:hypothetical protein
MQPPHATQKAKSASTPASASSTTAAQKQEKPQLWCYNSFVSNRETKLKKCGKCKIARYASREDQMAHWPVHKLVCGVPDVARVQQLDIEECLAHVRMALAGHATKDTTEIFKRVRHLMEEKDTGNIELGDIGLELHTMTRLVNVPEEEVVQRYARLWAVPGMPEYLLTEPMTSRARRELAAKKARGQPITKKDRRNKAVDRSAYEFAYLIFNVFIRTAIADIRPTHVSTNDGFGRLRSSPLAKVAADRALELWLDSHVQKDCADALAPAPSFVYTLLESKVYQVSALFERGLGLSCVFDFTGSTDPSIPARVLISVSLKEWCRVSDSCALDMFTSVYTLIANLEKEYFSEDVMPMQAVADIGFAVMQAILLPVPRRARLRDAAARNHQRLVTPSRHGKKVPPEANQFLVYMADRLEKARDPFAIQWDKHFKSFVARQNKNKKSNK